jgi:choline dehydrogenase-like flavoprotein
MGKVVDTECRVYGVEGLRVVDASIMPVPLATHYQHPVYAMGELACDMI